MEGINADLLKSRRAVVKGGRGEGKASAVLRRTERESYLKSSDNAIESAGGLVLKLYWEKVSVWSTTDFRLSFLRWEKNWSKKKGDRRLVGGIFV